MSLLYHAYVYLEFLILACTIYILAPEQRKNKTIAQIYVGTKKIVWILGTIFS